MSLWGPLEERYTSVRPRRMLTMDGGGIRGALTLEILAALEARLREKLGQGDEFRLCHFFDYVGGTSTGAIIATALATGMSVAELRDFYVSVGPKMFEKPWLLKRFKNLYKREPLAEQLRQVFRAPGGGNRTLEPKHLECLLLIVTKNVSTDSAWPISSNPLAKYNDPALGDCNLKIPLWQLVRASTAAPIFFPPEVLNWDPSNPDKSFVFADGGVTPYNNPAFLIFRMATAPAYRLGWPTGERNLMLISLGTGNAENVTSNEDASGRNLVTNLAALPGDLMFGSLTDQDLNCRTVGRCVQGHHLDGEVGDMVPRDEAGNMIPTTQDLGRAFLYARYDADLSQAGLEKMGLGHLKSGDVTKLDSVEQIPSLQAIGRKVGEAVDLSPFSAFL